MTNPNANPTVSIILSTYNRCDLLAGAIESLAAQTLEPDRYEIIIVDNNSTDATRTVCDQFTRRFPQVRYIFEQRQGLSFARNAGAQAATAEILAFTDDDVRASPMWLEELIRVFAQDPELSYVGGRVLPEWPSVPPQWLTGNNWSPLALFDAGDQPFPSDRNHPVCFVGANLAVRRGVYDRLGGFSPGLQRIRNGIGSIEDHEFQLRLWQDGGRGAYAPDVVMTAAVTPDRLTKAYHRRWHWGHGTYLARLQFYELSVRPWGPLGSPPSLVKLFGVPGFVYSDVARYALMAIRHRATGAVDQAFSASCRCRELVSYIVTSWGLFRVSKQSLVTDVVRFLRAYLAKHVQPASF